MSGTSSESTYVSSSASTPGVTPFIPIERDELDDASHSNTAQRNAGFSVLTKVVVLIAISASMSLTTQPLYSAFLTAALLLYLTANKQGSLAIKLLASYIVVFLLYAMMTYFGLKLFLFSPLHIFMAWKAYPVLIASIALVTSPPGTISAFLARFHLPKKVILGVLVIFRFFPTMRMGIHRLSEALKNRGLTGVKQIATNPLDTLEYLLVPTMMVLINSADQLSSSAIVRAAEAPTKRTSYYHNGLNWYDYLCQTAFVLIAVVFIILTGGIG